MPDKSICFTDFSAGYRNKPVVKDITLDILKGERFCILGPSGGGKTTLLNSITGIAWHSPDFYSSGTIEIDKANNGSVNNVGYVFQDLALFPHLTVKGNITFPLKIKKIEKSVIQAEAEKMLSILKLSHKRDSLVQTLSGGEKQRVALGRALINKPGILCLDEPLKGLDRVLKFDFMSRLMDIHEQLRFTLVFVTHDIEEANYMSDRIGILEGGEIRQLDTPAEIHLNPVSLSVASYSGPVIKLGTANITGLPEKLKDMAGAGNVSFFGFRPEALLMSLEESEFKVGVSDNYIYFTGLVRECRFTGKSHITWIQSWKDEFWVESPQYQKGDTLQLKVPLRSVYY